MTVSRLSHTTQSVRALTGAGILTPRVDRLVHKVRGLKRYGPGPAGAFSSAARIYPDRPYIFDEEGTLTFGEVELRTNRIANAMRAAGVREGDGVGILCRNGRAWVEATIATTKLGAKALFLNTDFGGPQLVDVLEREGGRAVIMDQEFDRLLPAGAYAGRRWTGYHEGPTEHPTLLSIAGPHLDASPPPAPEKTSRLVLLTSGTTGLPKGAARDGAPIGAVIGILDRIPFRQGQVHHIAAPLFHGWGLLNFTLGLALPTTIVLHRRFDPERVLASIQQHKAEGCAMVPTMLQRILDLPQETLAKYDTSSLKMIPLSGSALPGDLATRAIEQFGPVPYNFYGSTETGWATLATPADLAAAPGTAGTPPLGTGLLIVDDEGNELPQGQTGRIFVSSQLRMAGYTDPKLAKDHLAGHMSSGDVGHLDEAGRLFVDGRDDDMIVSGGENVFPREVEDLLANHEEIVEVAVFGVPDERFGQALEAFVVKTEDSQLDNDTVRKHVSENLARYKVPRQVNFLPELPRNPTGKVLKRVLKEQVAERRAAEAEAAAEAKAAAGGDAATTGAAA